MTSVVTSVGPKQSAEANNLNAAFTGVSMSWHILCWILLAINSVAITWALEFLGLMIVIRIAAAIQGWLEQPPRGKRQSTHSRHGEVSLLSQPRRHDNCDRVRSLPRHLGLAHQPIRVPRRLGRQPNGDMVYEFVVRK